MSRLRVASLEETLRYGRTLPPIAGGADFPVDLATAEAASAGGGVNYGTSVTSGAAGAKGSWVQLSASSAISEVEWALVTIGVPATGGAVTTTMVDIGVGAAGSEQVLVPNLCYAGGIMAQQYLIPVSVPAGQRISARAQNASASQIVALSLQLFGSSHGDAPPRGRVTDHNTFTSSHPLQFTAGVTGTKSAWNQIVASTANPMSWMLLWTNWTAVGTEGLGIDIGVGASGSEQAVLTNLNSQSSSTNPSAVSYSMPMSIPAGTRVSVRASQGQGTATTLQVGLWGAD